MFWDKTGAVFLLPTLDNRYEVDEHPGIPFFLEKYVEKVLTLSSIVIQRDCRWIIENGHASFSESLCKIPQLFQEKNLERILVIAADSYIEPSIIEWLLQNNRLKLPEKKTGLIPGEAGAAILLERDDLRTTVKHLAVISGASTAKYEGDDFLETKRYGTSMNVVISKTLDESGVTLPFKGEIMSDINGEDWRSVEIANALVKLTAQKIHSDTPLNTIADSFGEVGVVSPLIATVTALDFLSLNSQFLIVSISESGSVGSFTLRSAALNG